MRPPWLNGWHPTRPSRRFLRTQAVGLGIDNASQWKDLFTDGVKLVIVILILDRIGFIDNEQWLENHVDTMSVQAALFHGKSMSWLQSLKHFMESTSRVELVE